MKTADTLIKELENVLSGDHPWYGSSVYTIIKEVTFETAYEKPRGSAHTIAEIVLHMLSWTEEVLDRMNGKEASMPLSGDWPDTGKPDEQKWQLYVNDLKLVNVNLIGVIRNFPEEQWHEPISNDGNHELSSDVSYEGMVKGLIQHHVYHSAQISILNRIING